MMAIKQKIQSLLDALNSHYSMSFDNLTDAIQYAIDNGTSELPEELADIVEYYRSTSLSAKNHVNSEVAKGNVVFGVVTDTHGTGNKNNSQAILKYLLDNGMPWLIHLGDFSVSSYNRDEVLSYIEPFSDVAEKYYIAIGNHEYSGGNRNISVLTDAIANGKNGLVGNVENGYYGWDDASKKMRYIVLNTFTAYYNGDIFDKDNQIAFLTERVSTLPSDYSLILFGHADMDYEYCKEETPLQQSQYGYWVTKNAQEIVEIISTKKNQFVGYFCGHQHLDRSAQIGETGVWSTTLNCDKFEHFGGFSWITTPARDAGTVTEQSFNIVSVDKNTHMVNIKRIGAGNDIAYNYADLSGGLDFVNPNYNPPTEEPDEPSSNDWTYNKAITSNTGKISDYDDWLISPLIQITRLVNITFTAQMPVLSYPAIIECDENGNVVDYWCANTGVTQSAGVVDGTKVYTRTVKPAKGNYIRLQIQKGNYTLAKVIQNDVVIFDGSEHPLTQ